MSITSDKNSQYHRIGSLISSVSDVRITFAALFSDANENNSKTNTRQTFLGSDLPLLGSSSFSHFEIGSYINIPVRHLSQSQNISMLPLPQINLSIKQNLFITYGEANAASFLLHQLGQHSLVFQIFCASPLHTFQVQRQDEYIDA